MNTDPLQGAAPLADWGVIRASGADARAFLNGQLTQDVATLADGQARYAGYCSAKGRLLATFIVWPAADGELMLACSADLLSAVLKRLSMFVLRARCELRDASGDVPLHGLAGTVALEMLGGDAPSAVWSHARHDGRDIVRLPDAAGMPRFLCAGGMGWALPPLDPQGWRWLDVQSGVVHIVAATAEQFVPQMVNLELVGGVSFGKGCYPGQEVVARSQYRGTLKRRALLFASPAAAAPGDEVYAAADPDQPAGMVAAAATAPGDASRHLLLAEVKLGALDGALHLGSVSGPQLALRALPYALPAAS